MTIKCYYFGCKSKDDLGHYLFNGTLAKWRVTENKTPFKDLDGTYAPKQQDPQGAARLHHKDGWTALAFWDRSADKRYGSNSVFIAEGEHDFEQMISLFADYFPSIYARFPFSIFLVD